MGLPLLEFFIRVDSRGTAYPHIICFDLLPNQFQALIGGYFLFMLLFCGQLLAGFSLLAGNVIAVPGF